jgi:hypothetical protein
MTMVTAFMLHPSGSDGDLPIYDCYKTDAKIKVDGVIDEKVWDQAPESTFINSDGSKPRQKTTFKWLWDEKYGWLF